MQNNTQNDTTKNEVVVDNSISFWDCVKIGTTAVVAGIAVVVGSKYVGEAIEAFKNDTVSE